MILSSILIFFKELFCFMYNDINVPMIIKSIIKAKYPKHGILAEESGHDYRESEYLWVIDPIDGTTNFLHGIPHFAISIALQSNEEIVSALIFDPIKDEMYYSEKDKGAFLNNQRLRVSKKTSLDDCLFSSSLEGVKFSNLNMRYSGCAALDLAYVGCGRLDGFFHNKINLWDIAAGKIIVEEAGGRINEIQNFKSKIDIRAANPNIYEKMLNKLDNF